MVGPLFHSSFRISYLRISFTPSTPNIWAALSMLMAQRLLPCNNVRSDTTSHSCSRTPTVTLWRVFPWLVYLGLPKPSIPRHSCFRGIRTFVVLPSSYACPMHIMRCTEVPHMNLFAVPPSHNRSVRTSLSDSWIVHLKSLSCSWLRRYYCAECYEGCTSSPLPCDPQLLHQLCWAPF